MGIRERKEREREELRTRILDAAREMFATEGYEAVTMRKIAEKIEYSPTAIYVYFKDKEALIHELCDTDFLTLAQQFTKIARIPDPVERLKRTGKAYVEFGFRNPNHYRLMFMTPHPPQRPDDSAVEKGNPEVDAFAFLVSIVTEAMAAGIFRSDLKDPVLVSQVIWAGVHGVISLEIAKCNDEWIDWRPLEKRTRMMIDVLVDGLLEKRG